MTDAPPIAIEATDLTRTFHTFSRRPGVLGAVRDLVRIGGETITAVDGLDLVIRAGERVGIIGPNGAGKSTTIKLCTGILRPTSGIVRVGGRIPHTDRIAHARNIGVVFGQRTSMWWDLAVQEAFDLLAGIYGVEAATYRERLERFDAVLGTGPLLATPVRELSLGQRMRCDLAASLLHAPPILFLDEPTIGLDVAVQHGIRAFLHEQNQSRGTTIVLTTHDLSDVEALCERVILIDHGRVLFDGTPSALTDTLGGERRLVLHLPRPLDDAALAALTQDLPAEAEQQDDTVVIRFSGVSAAEIVRPILERVDVQDLRLQEPDIEHVVARLYAERAP